MDRHAVIAAESARFRDVLRDAPPDAPVPTCPDWTVADLAHHLAETHWLWAAVLGRAVTTDAEVEALEALKPPRPATVAESLVMLEAATSDLVAELADLPDLAPRWSWSPGDHTAGFTRRMQTYEATMHRVDAELALDLDPSPISDDVAAGAVDHAIEVMWGWVPEWARTTWHHTVALEAPQIEATWYVELGRWTGTGPESGTVFDEPRARMAQPTDSPAATARASVQDLALWLWGRGGEVEVVGEPSAVAAISEIVRSGIQ